MALQAGGVLSLPPFPCHSSLQTTQVHRVLEEDTVGLHVDKCRSHLLVFIPLKRSVTFDTVGYSLPPISLPPLHPEKSFLLIFLGPLSLFLRSLVTLPSSFAPSQRCSLELSLALMDPRPHAGLQ